VNCDTREKLGLLQLIFDSTKSLHSKLNLKTTQESWWINQTERL